MSLVQMQNALAELRGKVATLVTRYGEDDPKVSHDDIEATNRAIADAEQVLVLERERQAAAEAEALREIRERERVEREKREAHERELSLRPKRRRYRELWAHFVDGDEMQSLAARHVAARLTLAAIERELDDRTRTLTPKLEEFVALAGELGERQPPAHQLRGMIEHWATALIGASTRPEVTAAGLYRSIEDSRIPGPILDAMLEAAKKVTGRDLRLRDLGMLDRRRLRAMRADVASAARVATSASADLQSALSRRDTQGSADLADRHATATRALETVRGALDEFVRDLEGKGFSVPATDAEDVP